MSLRLDEILFVVFSHEPRHKIFMAGVQTWGKQLPCVRYALDYRPPDLDNVLYIPIKGRDNLSLKAKAMLDAAYEKYGSSTKWFVKVDGDSYVWVERLRRFLERYDPNESHNFGNAAPEGKLDYWPAGFVYILSRKALGVFHEIVSRTTMNHSSHEDAEVAKMLLFGNVPLTHVPQFSVYQRLDRVAKEDDLLATTSLSIPRMWGIHLSTRGAGIIPLRFFPRPLRPIRYRRAPLQKEMSLNPFPNRDRTKEKGATLHSGLKGE